MQQVKKTYHNYISDFNNCMKYKTSLSFADETNIFITDKNTKSL